LPRADIKTWERVVSDIQILPPNDPVFDASTRPSVEAAIQMIIGQQNGYQIPFAAVALNHHTLIPEQNLFRCLFGRDSLLIANLLGNRLPDLESNVVKALGSVQGARYEDLSEEEPGRIAHEVRDEEDERARILRTEGNWRFPYYGSVDATLLWIKAVDNISKKDPSILDFELNGVPLWKKAISATEWILRRVDTPSGFVESQRRNPTGIQNQVWKDSEDSYMHADGTLAQGDSTASIETVGETYDALLSAVAIQELRPSSKWPASNVTLNEQAAKLQVGLIDLLWLGDRFALGTERLVGGVQKPFDSQASNQGRLLDSSILNGIHMAGYREAIAAAVCDPQLLGDSGLRTLSTRHPSYRPGGYHTGSAWPMDAVFTARGLTRHGFHRESSRLLSKTKSAIESIGGYPEFFRGDSSENGLITTQITDVISDRNNGRGESNRVCQPPQMIQGWTVAAYAWIIDNFGRITNS
jgi:glycogen debranching enzyme